MILRIIILSLLFFAISCQNLNFIYKDSYNVTNPLHNKSSIKLTGKNMPAVNRYALRYFGNNQKGDYILVLSKNILRINKKLDLIEDSKILNGDFEISVCLF